MFSLYSATANNEPFDKIVCLIVATVQPGTQVVLRAYLHYRVEDQLAASNVYGRVMVISVIVVNGFFMGLQHRYHLVNLSRGAAMAMAVLWAFWLLVVRFQRISQFHFRLYLFACALFFAVFPSWSEMGGREERLLMWTAMLVSPLASEPTPLCCSLLTS